MATRKLQIRQFQVQPLHSGLTLKTVFRETLSNIYKIILPCRNQSHWPIFCCW